jgi:uncharacterized tellurite resistance protein B-like protein
MPSILFGSEPDPIRTGRGEFYCPHCGDRRSYQRTQVRRTLHLLGIKFSSGMIGEYVECDDCLSTFRPEVLAYDAGPNSQAITAEYQRAMKRILALMVAADGVVREPELEVVREIFDSVCGVQLTADDVLEEVEQVRQEPTTAARYLARINGNLNDYGREQILRAAALVSHSDGSLHEREAKMVRHLGAVMRVDPERVADILRGE